MPFNVVLEASPCSALPLSVGPTSKSACSLSMFRDHLLSPEISFVRRVAPCTYQGLYYMKWVNSACLSFELQSQFGLIFYDILFGPPGWDSLVLSCLRCPVAPHVYPYPTT